MNPEPEPLVKSQSVRLLDVFVLGPLMVYAATKLPKRSRPLAYALGFFGVTTVLYNAKNYAEIAARRV